MHYVQRDVSELHVATYDFTPLNSIVEWKPVISVVWLRVTHIKISVICNGSYPT